MYHHLLFPSIVSMIECENFSDIRSDLINWIYEYKKRDNGIVLSNYGGWQSQSNFHGDVSFYKYKKYILTHVEKIFDDLLNPNLKVDLDNMWININQKHDFNWTHVHPGCLYSGVFWIKCPKNSGDIRFFRPQTGWKENRGYKEEYVKNYYLSPTWQFVSSEGTISTFPADLMHCVTPNESDEDRISIAFNLQLKE